MRPPQVPLNKVVGRAAVEQFQLVCYQNGEWGFRLDSTGGGSATKCPDVGDVILNFPAKTEHVAARCSCRYSANANVNIGSFAE